MSLALETVIESFKKGDIVFRKGDPADCMFFVAKGQVEVVSEDGTQVYDTIKEGDFFGEVGMYFKISRTATIRVASETLDCIVLSRKSLNKVLTQYPDNYKSIIIQAEARYQRTQKRNEEGGKGKLWRKSISTPPSKQITEQINKPSWKNKFRRKKDKDQDGEEKEVNAFEMIYSEVIPY
jgi:CRP-like cAMP-binding protein